MTPAPDLDILLPDDERCAVRRRALVQELPDATRSGRGRGARALTALAAVVGISAIGTSFDPGDGRGRLDVVTEARAAVTATDAILHVRVRYDPGRFGSMGYVASGPDQPVIGRLTGVTERWSTAEPPREHRVDFVAPTGGGAPATMRTDYAAGVVRRHSSWERTVTVTRLDARRRRIFDAALQPSGRLTLDEAGSSADPVVAIRSLLSTGLLRPDGSRDLDGREVLRLAGEWSTNETADRSRSRISYEYLVDAETYAPVQITRSQLLEARPGDPEPAARVDRLLESSWTFETFERLALDERNEQLLRIPTAGLSVREVGRPSTDGP